MAKRATLFPPLAPSPPLRLPHVRKLANRPVKVASFFVVVVVVVVKAN